MNKRATCEPARLRKFWRTYWQAILAGVGLTVIGVWKAGWAGLAFALAACIFFTVFVGRVQHVLDRVRRRRSQIEALAQRNHWSFDRVFDPIPLRSISPFTQLLRGSQQRMENIISGTIGAGETNAEFIAGDFDGIDVFQTTKGKYERVHVFSFILCDLARPVGSPLLIRPQSTGDDLVQVFSQVMAGSSDIDFESVEFNRRFIVRCADKRLAYELVNPRVMHLFLEFDPPPIAIDGGHMCITDCTHCWSASEFERCFTFLERLLALWPGTPSRHGC